MTRPLSPAAAARSLRKNPGFFFLDSGQPEAGSVSLLGVNPSHVHHGHCGECGALEERLAANRRASSWSDGGLVGWMDFGGEFCFAEYEHFYVFDHTAARWMDGMPPPGGGWERPRAAPIPDFQPVIGQDDFVRAVRRAQEFIAAGDIYQACLSHPLRCEFSGDAYPFYEALRQASPAPYAAFLDLAGMQIASSSPECFLRIEGREIVTQPIKGTKRRGVEPVSDERAARELLASSKEAAELVMITDLERNDLGRLCEYGSIAVTGLRHLEKFRHVHHLVSTVRGRLRAEITHPAALASCSPGGSISGAPKLRALEIIRQLEPWSRGVYTGALGVFGFHGASCFSMAIRTAVFREGRGEFGVGAGIVADSDPALEWQETLDKAAGLREAVSLLQRGGSGVPAL